MTRGTYLTLIPSLHISCTGQCTGTDRCITAPSQPQSVVFVPNFFETGSPCLELTMWTRLVSISQRSTRVLGLKACATTLNLFLVLKHGKLPCVCFKEKSGIGEFLTCLHLFIANVCMHIRHGMYVEVREQLVGFVGVGFFFPPCGFWGLNSSCEAWQQASLPIESSPWPLKRRVAALILFPVVISLTIHEHMFSG